MLFNLKKFSREINWLKRLDNSQALQPLILAQVKNRVLAAIASPEAEPKPALSLSGHGRRVFKYLIPSLLTLGLCAGTAFASSSALPGNLLYPVKKVTEKVQLTLAVNPRAKAELKSKFAQERLNELVKLNGSAKKPVSHANQSNKSVSNQEDSIRLEAENNAKADVADALESLRQVKTSLEAKGNGLAAAQVRENIIKLKIKARAENLIELETNPNDTDEKPENRKSQEENSQEQVKGSATINSNFVAPKTDTQGSNLVLPDGLKKGQDQKFEEKNNRKADGESDLKQESQTHSDAKEPVDINAGD